MYYPELSKKWVSDQKHSQFIPELFRYNQISEEDKKKDLHEPKCNLFSNILNSMSNRSQVYHKFHD